MLQRLWREFLYFIFVRLYTHQRREALSLLVLGGFFSFLLVRRLRKIKASSRTATDRTSKGNSQPVARSPSAESAATSSTSSTSTGETALTAAEKKLCQRLTHIYAKAEPLVLPLSSLISEIKAGNIHSVEWQLSGKTVIAHGTKKLSDCIIVDTMPGTTTSKTKGPHRDTNATGSSASTKIMESALAFSSKSRTSSSESQGGSTSLDNLSVSAGSSVLVPMKYVALLTPGSQQMLFSLVQEHVRDFQMALPPLPSSTVVRVAKTVLTVMAPALSFIVLFYLTKSLAEGADDSYRPEVSTQTQRRRKRVTRNKKVGKKNVQSQATTSLRDEIKQRGYIRAFWKRLAEKTQGTGGQIDNKTSEIKFKLIRPRPLLNDVTLPASVKAELQEVVDSLNHPERYRDVSGPFRGVLLTGPAGTGKTMVAKAIANEADAGFLTCCGSELIELYVGRGAARVRTIFKRARAIATATRRNSAGPGRLTSFDGQLGKIVDRATQVFRNGFRGSASSDGGDGRNGQTGGTCVVFFDEIDAIGSRGSAGSSFREEAFSVNGGHSETVQTVNQLLHELDGFSKNGFDSDHIMVLGATNRYAALDAALLRPGRFDRQIFLQLPGAEQRLLILEKALADKPLILRNSVSENERSSRSSFGSTSGKAKAEEDKSQDERSAQGVTSDGAGEHLSALCVDAMMMNFSGADIAHVADEAVYISLRRTPKLYAEKVIRPSNEMRVRGGRKWKRSELPVGSRWKLTDEGENYRKQETSSSAGSLFHQGKKGSPEGETKLPLIIDFDSPELSRALEEHLTTDDYETGSSDGNKQGAENGEADIITAEDARGRRKASTKNLMWDQSGKLAFGAAKHEAVATISIRSPSCRSDSAAESTESAFQDCFETQHITRDGDRRNMQGNPREKNASSAGNFVSSERDKDKKATVEDESLDTEDGSSSDSSSSSDESEPEQDYSSGLSLGWLFWPHMLGGTDRQAGEGHQRRDSRRVAITFLDVRQAAMRVRSQVQTRTSAKGTRQYELIR
ncbi:unnamed protein product [Amoebophrya sp. A25]|nr:unnamed protein product [Amoebophrya sp. A25]|eukprot:GSA25T00017460001.1